MPRAGLRCGRCWNAPDAGRIWLRARRSVLWKILLPVPAAQCRRDRFWIPDALDEHVDAIATPEQFAVEDHGRHAEHAERFRLVDDAVVFCPRRAVDIILEFLCRAA